MKIKIGNLPFGLVLIPQVTFHNPSSQSREIQLDQKKSQKTIEDSISITLTLKIDAHVNNQI